MTAPASEPRRRENTTPRAPEDGSEGSDHEMAIDKATDGTAEKVPEQGRQVAKRARISMGGDSTVSRTIPHSRDTSPLRKTAPQSDWAHDFTLPVPMPDNVREWNKTYAHKLPYHREYDELIYARVPTGRHMNPHLWLTQQEPRPELPLAGHEAFTPGPFPYVHINHWRHLGNLQPALKTMLEKDLGRFLAIIPHGGGRAVNEQAQAVCTALEEIFWTFRFAGYNGEAAKVTVMAPDPRNVAGANGTNDFAQPWPMFADLANDEKGLLRAFLLNQQHFAFDRSRSFSVHSMEESPTRSWKTVLLVSHLIAPPGVSHGNIVDARAAIRREVIRRLAEDEDYRVLIAQLAANHISHSGNRDQIFQTVTDTYHLELTMVDGADGTASPAFVLLARPIVDSRQELVDLKSAIIAALCGGKSPRDDDHFYVGTKKIRVVDDAKPRPRFYVDCKLCKSELHCTLDCPLPKSRGWRGVQPKDIGFTAEAEKPKAAVPARAILEGVFDRLGQRAAGRGRGRTGEHRGRGRGGQGNRGRGKAPSRG